MLWHGCRRQRAALEAVAAEQRGVEAGAGGTGLDDPGHGAGVDRDGADAGQGYWGRRGRAAGVQVRRNTAPSACVLPGRAARGSANERSVVRVE
jgi:hypothetical protein